MFDLSYIIAQAGGQKPQGPGAFVGFIVPIILMFVVMYLLLIRPQRKKDQRRRDMLDSVKKGDKVVTIGGIQGQVVSVKTDDIIVKVADNVHLKLTKRAISRIVGSEFDDEREEES